MALYTDRDTIFASPVKEPIGEPAATQFGRALGELQIDLILAGSPQAKGRVERFFQLAQDRWVKELRLADARTMADANRLVEQRLVPEYNRRFRRRPASPNDAHRGLGPRHNPSAILSVQERRVVTNDYTVRYHNRCFQLHKPALPGLRQGRVVLEERLDGTLAIRFGARYLDYHEIDVSRRRPGGSAPRPPEFNAFAAAGRCGGGRRGL